MVCTTKDENNHDQETISSGRLQENDMSLGQYNAVCKDEFAEIKNALKAIEKRLFIDNGTKSIQTILTEVKIWQANHDSLQEKHNKCDSDNFSFFTWFMTNWKTISAFIFIVIWIVTQLYPGRSLSVDQQKEIRELLQTVIVDTRPVDTK